MDPLDDLNDMMSRFNALAVKEEAIERGNVMLEECKKQKVAMDEMFNNYKVLFLSQPPDDFDRLVFQMSENGYALDWDWLMEQTNGRESIMLAMTRAKGATIKPEITLRFFRNKPKYDKMFTELYDHGVIQFDTPIQLAQLPKCMVEHVLFRQPILFSQPDVAAVREREDVRPEVKRLVVYTQMVEWMRDPLGRDTLRNIVTCLIQDEAPDEFVAAAVEAMRVLIRSQ